MNEGEVRAGLPATPQYLYAQQVGDELFLAGQVPNDALGHIVAHGDSQAQVFIFSSSSPCLRIYSCTKDTAWGFNWTSFNLLSSTFLLVNRLFKADLSFTVESAIESTVKPVARLFNGSVKDIVVRLITNNAKYPKLNLDTAMILPRLNVSLNHFIGYLFICD